MKNRYPFLPKTWFRFSLAAAFTASFSLNLQAQTAPAKQWDKSFGGSGGDDLLSLQQTTDGGYILGGYSNSPISADKSQPSIVWGDYWIIKTDQNGNKIWDKTFGGGGAELFNSLQQTSDGGYLLGGCSASGISGDKTQAGDGMFDYWIVKTNSNGNKIWDKSIGGDEDDWLIALQQTSDGGYILGGWSTSNITGSKSQARRGGSDYWIVKIDANGNKLWDKTFGGSDREELYSLQQTSDGGYIIGGFSASGISGDKTQGSQGNFDYWVVKLDASGNKVWDKTFGGTGLDILRSLNQTSDGGYLLGGFSESGMSGDKSQASRGNRDYWIIKIDANGTKLWDKTLGGNQLDNFFSLKQTLDGGFILGGSSESSISGDKTETNIGSEDFWVIKLDNNGNKVWDKTLGSNSYDRLVSLWQTLDHGYILGGSTSSTTMDHDYLIVKLGASPTGIKEPETSFNLSISPNPNQGKFSLHLSNLTTSKAEVIISDLLGRVVLQKEIQTSNNQIHEVLTLPNAKGIYLLQLKAGEQIITRKVVVE